MSQDIQLEIEVLNALISALRRYTFNDNRHIVGMIKFQEFVQRIIFSNNALIWAENSHIEDDVYDEVKDTVRYAYLEHAILSCNSCMDYVLQTVYFLFCMGKNFQNEKQYNSQLRDVGWQKSVEKCIMSYLNNPDKTPKSEFCEKIKLLYDSSEHVRKWSNCIKHHGFLDTEYTHAFIPSIAYINVSPFTPNKDSDGKIVFTIDHSKTVFLPSWVKPIKISFDYAYKELQNQIEKYRAFAKYLEELLKLNKGNLEIPFRFLVDKDTN